MNNTTAHLKHLGIDKLNSLQEESLRTIPQHKQVILLAPTGSGKTLAFLLPLLTLVDPKVHQTQVLILSPSRELCLQIHEVWKSLKTGISSQCCYGGHAFQTETNELKNNPQVIIGTPGRIKDHFSRGQIAADCLQTLIFDEFDKTLEFGFEPDVKEIYTALTAVDRHIFTSATVLNKIPAFIQLDGESTLVNHLKDNETRYQYALLECSDSEKMDALKRLLSYLPAVPTLVFCNHKEAVNRMLAHFDAKTWYCDAFHGDLTQFERERALTKFRQGSVRLLFVTDLASRGIDIPEIEQAIHFQLPDSEAIFTHRNGRTARFENAQGHIYVVQNREEQPAYMEQIAFTKLEVPETITLPAAPTMETLYFSGGKKNKISKGDLLGYLIKTGGLQNSQIGKIHIMDNASFVAIERKLIKNTLAALKDTKIKKQKLRISVAN